MPYSINSVTCQIDARTILLVECERESDILTYASVVQKRCGNSVVTRLVRGGSTLVRAQVFRAGGEGSARGWGLRAAVAVSRGTPVATYCGELLTLDVADTRSRDQYMFSLDLKPDLLDVSPSPYLLGSRLKLRPNRRDQSCSCLFCDAVHTDATIIILRTRDT